MLASLGTPSSVLPVTPFRGAQLTSRPTKVCTSPSSRSVFPAEACEIIGGDACLAEVFPETKLKQGTRSNAALRTASEVFDRDYLDYTDAKTVFKGDACDVFGGEFCGRQPVWHCVV